MTGLSIWLDALRVAATDWESYSEDVKSAKDKIGLAEYSTASLGTNVELAANTFTAAWIARLEEHRRDASEISTVLTTSHDEYLEVDLDQHDILASYMRWGDWAKRPTDGDS